MFDEIMQKFEGSPSQQAVIRLLLERGFSVNDDGRVVSGSIEIPNTQIAREIGVVPSLMDLAPVLDLTVLTIDVTDADEPGIVARVTTLLAENGISIRQTVSEDPEFTDEPRLYLVTDEDVPGDGLNQMKNLDFVRKIELK
ncbi:amino acid-binding protein [Halobacteriales archaeon SW_6_65_15]|nr:MAG: amino acid-binding protein [Halobacteriales archaeon SW_6_65_15]